MSNKDVRKRKSKINTTGISGMGISSKRMSSEETGSRKSHIKGIEMNEKRMKAGKKEVPASNKNTESSDSTKLHMKEKSISSVVRHREITSDSTKLHMKEEWKPGNMLYPLPAVLVSVRGSDGEDILLTVAWAGTICSDPAMLSISVRPSRHSYKMIMDTGVFVVNLTTRDLVRATDYCGVRSGSVEDKWVNCGLHKEEAAHINAPMVRESPVNIECRVVDKREYGSHTMFVAEVLAVHADKAYMNKSGRFDLLMAKPIVYSHGEYFDLGKKLGSFGFSVKK